MRVCTLTKDYYEELSVFLEGQTQGAISRDVWMDRFPCFWDHNPLFKEERDQRGWLVINDQNRIGGCFSNILMPYYHKGEEKVFSSATSWYVEPSCRRHSLTVCRRFLKQDGTKLDTTPTPDVAFILQKMGFRSFEAPWLKKNYIFPISAWEFACFLRYRLFKNKIILAVSACMMPLLALLTASYKFLYALRNSEKKEGRYSIREIDAFGEEYDAFWDQFRQRFDILAVRNQRTLNWLFFGTPHLKSQRKVLEIRKEQELIGYAALREVVRHVGHRKIRYYELVDAALLEDNDKLFLELLEGMKSMAYKHRISFIKIYPLFAYWESLMRRKGFIRMKKEHRFLYRDCPDDLQGVTPWLTPLDGDRGLF